MSGSSMVDSSEGSEGALVSAQSSGRVTDEATPTLGWVRVAAVLAVAIASISGVLALWFALDFYDGKADHFASLSYRDRQYGKWRGVPTVIREPRVVERALDAMPADARYRVVVGANWVPSYVSHASTTLEADFLRFYLLPRRQTTATDARWAFCLGCDLPELGRVRVIAGRPGGMQFVEIVR